MGKSPSLMIPTKSPLKYSWCHLALWIQIFQFVQELLLYQRSPSSTMIVDVSQAYVTGSLEIKLLCFFSGNETVCRVDTMRVKPFSRDNMYRFQGPCGYVLLSSCDVAGPSDFVGATADFQLDSGEPLSTGFFIRGTYWVSLEDGQAFSNADGVQLPDDENGATVFSFPDFDVITRQSPGVNSIEVGGDYQVVLTHQYGKGYTEANIDSRLILLPVLCYILILCFFCHC